MTTKTVSLSPAREREIATLAERIALRAFSAGRVEPEQIALREGISFCYSSFAGELDGVLAHGDGRFFIFCNERRSRRGAPRSRFTFAHELGHYFIPDHRRAVMAGKCGARYRRSEFAWDPTFEKEADLFAANLLMPATLFKANAADGVLDLKRISALASDYGVSPVAAAYRAIELELLPAPAAVFQWDRRGEAIGRKMSRVTYLRSLPFAGTAPMPPPCSVTARAIARRARGVQDDFIAAPEWFPECDCVDDFLGLELHEEVMALGRFGWITLVSSCGEGVRLATQPPVQQDDLPGLEFSPEPDIIRFEQIVVAENARRALSNAEIIEAVKRHAAGDWGEAELEDRAANERALAFNGRLCSVFRSRTGIRFYVITQADHHTTTILFPSEY